MVRAREELVDAGGGALAGADRLDHRRGAGHGVAAGEDPVDRGPPGLAVGGEVAPPVELDRRAVEDGRGVELLPDGGDHRVGLDHERRVVAGHGLAPPAPVVVAKGHARAAHARHVALGVTEDLLRGHEGHDLDALEVGGVDLLAPRRHLGPRATVEDLDRLGAEADGGPGGVDGRVPAADDRHVRADPGRAVEVVVLEEGEAVVHAGTVLAGDADAHASRGADGDEHGFVALVAEALQREVAAERLPVLEVHAHALDHRDLARELLAWQAVGRDGLDQHAAGLGLRLEDDRLVSEPGEEVGGGKAGGSGADDRHLAAGVLGVLADLRELRRRLLLDHEALDLTDRQRAVEGRAHALALARMEAHASADARQRVPLAMEPERLVVPALGHKAHEPGDVDVRRARVGTAGFEQA